MSKYCPACGVELVDDAKFCKNCGSKVDAGSRIRTPQSSSDVNSHTAAIILGYILAVLIPLLGIIIAIYLLTRKDSKSASRHGKYIIIVAIIIWILGILSSFVIH